MEAAGLKPKDVAPHLGVGVDTVRRYTNRLLMPHHMIPEFCRLTNTRPEYFFNDRAPSGLLIEQVREPKAQKRLPAPAKAKRG